MFAVLSDSSLCGGVLVIKDMLAIKRKDRPSALEVLERTNQIIVAVQKANHVDIFTQDYSSLNGMADISNSLE